jgi:hypothetical protein
MGAGDRRQRRLRRQRALLAQLVREHVEQHFRIRAGVDVAAVLLEDLASAVASMLIRLPLCASAMPQGEFT